jgi:hypothetical protein
MLLGKFAKLSGIGQVISAKSLVQKFLRPCQWLHPHAERTQADPCVARSGRERRQPSEFAPRFRLRRRNSPVPSHDKAMPEDLQYDVFLSHSAKDKAMVRALAERLKGGRTPAVV